MVVVSEGGGLSVFFFWGGVLVSQTHLEIHVS